MPWPVGQGSAALSGRFIGPRLRLLSTTIVNKLSHRSSALFGPAVIAGKTERFHGFPPHLSHNVATFWVKDMQCFADCRALAASATIHVAANRTRSLWRYALAPFRRTASGGVAQHRRMGSPPAFLAVANTSALLCEGRSTDDVAAHCQGRGCFGVSGDGGLSHGSHGGGYHGRTAAGIDRSRPRAAAVGQRPRRDLHRPPPRFRAVVQRHHSDRFVRRCPDRRRRFHSTRRRDHLRLGAGAHRGRAARRLRRQRKSHHPQDRPPAAAERSHGRAPGDPRLARRTRRQPRIMRVRPFVRISGNLSLDDQRALGQDPAVQRPAAADRRRLAAAGRRRGIAGRRGCGARCGGFVRHARPRRDPAARRRSPPRSRSTTS